MKEHLLDYLTLTAVLCFVYAFVIALGIWMGVM